MKTIILKTFALFIFISLVFFSTGISKCEAGPALIKKQSEAQFVDKRAEERKDSDWQANKNSRFIMLVEIIRDNLVDRYQQLDEQELAEGYVQFFGFVEMID